jgi:hypothetical protein
MTKIRCPKINEIIEKEEHYPFCDDYNKAFNICTKKAPKWY